MKQLIIFIILIFVAFTAKSQLDKGIWLAGGSGTLNSYNQVYSSPALNNTAKYTNIELSASIGYFLIDKLALGLSPSFSYLNGEIANQGLVSGPTKYSIGPFLRYYFLNSSKSYNLLADIRYLTGITKMPNPPNAKGKLTKFSIMAGPEIFFNSSVGLEFLLGYSAKVETINGPTGYKDIRKGFQVSVGFQIHLEKK